MPEREDVTFPSQGELLSAWRYRGDGDAFQRPNGRPCVVMAHGIGGTKDAGMEPFAQAFAEAGLEVVLFDYRNFGGSTGEPRQLGIPPRHREDYRSAVDFARGLDGVDIERIVLWGTSWSAGHAVYTAADDRGVAAVLAQTPDLDGVRTLREIAKYAGWGQLLRVTVEGIKDQVRALRGQPPHLIPVVAPPGRIGAMTSEEAEPGYLAIAGPSWKNEISARAVLHEARNRAITVIDRISRPILVQIADRDSIAPPPQARAAAWRAKGHVEVREYPCAHFDIYVGEWRERAIADQLHFLRRHLGSAAEAKEVEASEVQAGGDSA